MRQPVKEPVPAGVVDGIPRYWKVCEAPGCGRDFVGTAKSHYCGGTCRVAAHRAARRIDAQPQKLAGR